MIKKLLLVSLLLTGCVPDQLTYAKADYLCKPHGGIFSLGRLSGATCKDGTAFTPNEIVYTIIPIESVEEHFRNTGSDL